MVAKDQFRPISARVHLGPLIDPVKYGAIIGDAGESFRSSWMWHCGCQASRDEGEGAYRLTIRCLEHRDPIA